MPWGRLDDGYPEHPKIVALGKDAAYGIALDTCAWAYCNRALTDGFIADEMVTRISPVPGAGKIARRLAEVGRWDRVVGGYLVHGYLKRNKSAEQILKERAANAARQRRHRDPDAASNAVTSAVSNGYPVPVPPGSTENNSPSSLRSRRDNEPSAGRLAAVAEANRQADLAAAPPANKPAGLAAVRELRAAAGGVSKETTT